MLHFVFDKNEPIPLKPFPANPLPCLVFYVRGSVTAHDPNTGLARTFPAVSLNSSITRRLDFSISHDCLLLSVGFRPGALAKLVRMPLTEFVDERVDAEAILSNEIHQVQEQMTNATTYAELVQIAEDYLWQRIQKVKMDVHPIDSVAQLVFEGPNRLSIDKMAHMACLSISQFERRFIHMTGVTPKFFARITRFHTAYQLKDRNPTIDWLSVALQTGYYDYQHLVKDFKQFANDTPASLLEAQAHSPERLLGIG